jgi:hypothetical protein
MCKKENAHWSKKIGKIFVQLFIDVQELGE